MRKTTNYGLALYDSTDKMSITAEENSLNANMKIIDNKLKELENNSSNNGTHTHDNKDILDSITQEDINKWNNGSGGTVISGLSNSEKNLMLYLFKNAIYNIDVNSTIIQLETLWSSTDNGGTVKEYSITNILSNVLNNNSTANVVEGQPYTATLTPSVGYNIYNVIITMGGKDITSLVYDNGVINISNVTDNVIITASASDSEVLIYEIGTLDSGNDGLEKDSNFRVRTDFIPCKGNEKVIVPNNYFVFFYYDTDKTYLGQGKANSSYPWFFGNGTMATTCAYMRILCLPDLNNPDTVITSGSYDGVSVTVGNKKYTLKEV